jgi:diguanylate cyclase (GGDEF)-like protein/PAS domain S-box-containing protein
MRLRQRFIWLSTAGYLVMALGWIFLSDRLLESFVDLEAALWLSTAKGVFFVVASAGVFFLLMRAMPDARGAEGVGESAAWVDVASTIVRSPRRSTVLVWLFALCISVVMLAVRQGMAQGSPDRPMLMLFMFPVILSALIGGLGPGLLSTVVVALGADWLAIKPVGSLRIDSSHDLMQWSFLCLNGGVVSFLSELVRRSLDKARASVHLLDVMAQGTSDAVFVKDLAGRYILVNQAAAGFVGKPQADMLGKDDQALFSPESAEELRRKDAAVLARGDVSTHTERLEARDGRRMVFWVTKGPVRGSDGEVVGLFGISRDVTEREDMLAQLREREQRLARVLEGSNQGYWDWNMVSGHIELSPRFETMLGYEAGSLQLSTHTWPQVIHPDDVPDVTEAIQRHRRGEAAELDVEMRVRTAAGGWCWIHSRGRIVQRDAAGEPLMMSGTHTDITEQKRYRLASSESATVLDSLYEGVMVVGLDRKVLRVNPAFQRITGYEAAEVVGQSPRMLSSGRHGAAFYQAVWDSLDQRGHWHGEIWNRRKNGEIYPELLSISAIRDERGRVQHHVGVFSDISRLKAHETELYNIAHFDALTGMPNRLLLGDRLTQALARAQRQNNLLAVCYLDLDGFKDINDTHGHTVGDRLLVWVAERLKQALRADDTLARLGGDEFVLLMSDLPNQTEGLAAAERVLKTIAEPVVLDGVVLNVSASLGLTLYPQDASDADTLLRHADQAMYLAKDAGKNRCVLFDPVHDREVQAHRERLARLRKAHQNNEWVLYYQPKVDLNNGDVIGMEALIRWQHPERGVLSPAEFMPLLEGSELEFQVGDWVIRTALAQMAQWHGAGLPLAVSVNIGAAHLLHPDFVDNLRWMLQSQPDAPAVALELEILETVGLADVDRAVEVLTRCRALGVACSLDDFGTGYSSLAYFRRLPVHMVKIDQSFVRDMLFDDNDFGIVDSVVRLSKAFNRQVIAEGVETMDHGARLMAIGCHLAQGYGIARPMPSARVAEWMAQWQQHQPWRSLPHPHPQPH